MVAASRQAEVLHGAFQDAQAGSVRRAVALNRRMVEVSVTDPLSPHLQLSSPHDASGDLHAGLAAATWLAQAPEIYARDMNVQVQAIEQRTRNAGAISLHLISSAVASIVRVAKIATGTST